MKERYISAVATAVLTVGAFLFFRFSYWGHIRSMEFFQFFVFDGAYFMDTVKVPGGLSDYAGRFLTQFFLFPSAGAAIVAILVCSVQLLAYKVSGQGGIFAYALSFIPAACVWIYLVSDYCVAAPVVSIVFSLLMLWIYRKYPNPYLLVFSALPAYMICGPIAVLYLLPAALRSRPIASALSLLLPAVFAFAGRFVWNFRPAAFFYGLHYSQYMLNFPVFAWIAAGGTLLFLLAAPFAVRLRKGKYAASVLTLAAVAAAMPYALSFTRNDFDEKIFRYDHYATMRDWDGLLALSEKVPSDNLLCSAYINIALAKTGRMGEDLFKHNCSGGPSCLLPPVDRHHSLALPTAEAYWQIGIPNAALSVWFDCQEAIPDGQKSAVLSKCIAECLAVNGNMTAAEHYLEPLRHTLFYSRWARSFDAAAPEYEAVRRWSREVLDINACDAGLLLYNIAKASPDNDVAFAYSMSFCLLTKQLVNFLPIINLRRHDSLPSLYQQAYLLLYFQEKHTLDNLPSFIDPAVALRFGKYLSAREAGHKASALHRKYGDTFWFYHDFVKTEQ